MVLLARNFKFLLRPQTGKLFGWRKKYRAMIFYRADLKLCDDFFVSRSHGIMVSLVYLKMNFNFRPMLSSSSADCDLMDDDGRMRDKKRKKIKS